MRILALDIAPDAPVLASLATQGELVVAPSVDQADKQVAGGDVDVIVVAPTSRSRGWLSSLSVENRPALLLAGLSADRALAEADEWVAESASEGEVATRLRVAMKRARLRRRAVRRGNVDPLTGLPNRRGVMVALLRGVARSRRQGTRLSLVMLDLDHFKRINEQQGHDAGDRVLRKVGRVLRSATRQDEVCGRIGGDEFMVVVVGDAHHAELVGRRVSGALASAGIAATYAWNELGVSESLRELYRRVDAQLRARKRQPHGWPAQA